jgi:hypothetical protein
MKTLSRLWHYLTEFFLEWEIFQMEVVEDIKTHILYFVPFLYNCSVYEMKPKNVVEPAEATNDNMRFACRVSKATRSHAHMPANPHTHMRAATRARARTNV